MSHDSLNIRAATAADTEALAHLLNDCHRHRPADRMLVAELDGAPVAAISLTSGGVAADPQRTHPDTIRALRHRRYQILHQGGDVAHARTLLRRLAGAPRTCHTSGSVAAGG